MSHISILSYVIKMKQGVNYWDDASPRKDEEQSRLKLESSVDSVGEHLCKCLCAEPLL